MEAGRVATGFFRCPDQACYKAISGKHRLVSQADQLLTRLGDRSALITEIVYGRLSDHRGSPENVCLNVDSQSSAARGSGPFWTAASASSNCCGVAIPTKIVPIAG